MLSNEGRIEPRLQTRWQDREHPHDLPQLEQLFHDCFPRENWTVADFIKFRQKQTRHNTIKVLVGHEDDANCNELYGVVMYTVEELRVRVRRVAIFPQYRRRRYGSFLMSFLVGKRSGVRRKLFEANVPVGNLPAQCFFRSLKFIGPEDGKEVEVHGKQVFPFSFHKDLGVRALVGV